MKSVAKWMSAVVLLCLPAFGEIQETVWRETHEILRHTVTFHVVPTMANTPGLHGAFFKTRVVLYNPTGFEYLIYVGLFGPQGHVETKQARMMPYQQVVSENFLQDVFNYRGAGAVIFDSQLVTPGGDEAFQFSVSAEVYTDSPNGRYTTVVANGEGGFPLDIGSNGVERGVLTGSPGVNVNSRQRLNVGVFNITDSAQIIRAYVLNSILETVQTITFQVPALGWAQKAVSARITNGFIVWESTDAECLAYPWAVMVDNQSNDGVFFPAMQYDPEFEIPAQ